MAAGPAHEKVQINVVAAHLAYLNNRKQVHGIDVTLSISDAIELLRIVDQAMERGEKVVVRARDGKLREIKLSDR